MSELEEIMQGKHEINHMCIDEDTISFDTELNSHIWNLTPRGIEQIIYNLQKERDKYKEVLDKIKEYIEYNACCLHDEKILNHILELLEEIE